ncbi:hypothetical protein A3F19_02825 [Candidatus Nomurabacteria bacterium RIFCSPHIGHO2_12_FULL_37_29]|uniref:NAD(P)-binding domain-containing protein n=2 Tax=Parcubacteria group TaxID=1794811 RepID=A0A1G2UNG9_9BACT|nr:MAG: hypothetical protein A3F19_02825 [Candidatus Nomurabacteria bacterium RIFCSPHIGHO2_12_FULL_37_29]OHB10892.1 MAG: hypothetical protein A3H60_02065 [Candidatus Zambryskibacteria bacterium RIFCSPLOWO2_02_FULL_44_12b]
MKITKIVVIGSNSFFGSHFVDQALTNTDWKVVGISRSPEYKNIFLPYLYKKKRSKNFKFLQLDVNNDHKKINSLFDKEKPDVVVNFAAQGYVPASWESPEDWFKTNCLGIVKLADHLRRQDYLKKYIQISTPEVYGSIAKMKEDLNYFNPTTPYAASKAAGDLFLSALFQGINFPVSFVRVANVYGPHQQPYRIIPSSVILLKKKKKIVLWAGGIKRNFLYVTDASNGILKVIMKGKPGQVYHFTGGKNISIKDLVKTICGKMGVPYGKMVKDASDSRIKRDQIYHLNGTRTEKNLDWRPEISLSQGLDRVIGWVHECWDELKKSSLTYIHKK